MTTHQEGPTFSDFPFSECIHSALAEAGHKTPTPIQVACIGPALEGRDIIGLAQTGTGKTAAFALPIIHRAAHRMELSALVLAPTRELAQQIVAMFQMLGRSSDLRIACTVGGISMENDWKALSSWPNVLVATPGRLIDHLESGTITLKEIETFVVDEADRMHDMGFIPQIRRVIAALPENRQTLMFTATMPADVERIVRQNMRDPVRIQVGARSMPVERAEQQVFAVGERDKTPLLLHLLKGEGGRVLVFLRTKRGVDRLASRIGGRRHTVARIHGDREMAQRNTAMQGFRDGRYRVLIATDIAARGIDVADVEHVINYDFPRAPEDYVHRIGRTARLAASGWATSFVTPADRKYLADVERLIGAKISVSPPPIQTSGGREDRAGRDEAGTRPRRSHGRRDGGRPPHAAAETGRTPSRAEGQGGGTRKRRRRGRRNPAAASVVAGAASDGPAAGGPPAVELEAPAVAAAPPSGEPRKRRRRPGRSRTAGDAAESRPVERASAAAGPRGPDVPPAAREPERPQANEVPPADLADYADAPLERDAQVVEWD